MKRRTPARRLAAQVLYQLELFGWSEEEGERRVHEGSPDEQVVEYALGIVRGVLQHREEIDRRIQEISKNWALDRMSPIDRNVLRVAAYELFYVPEVPPRVALNEAIELAKKYSTAKSGAFVNGILDALMKKYPREQTPPASVTR